VNSAVTGDTVPTWILRTVEDVISGRKFAASFWSAQKGDDATSDVRDSNERHLYFIYILEEVLEILKGGVAPEVNIPQRPNDPTQNGDGAAEDGLKNAFSALEIEEPSDKFLEWSTTQSSTVSLTEGKTNSTTKSATYELEIDEEEIFFAVYFLLTPSDPKATGAGNQAAISRKSSTVQRMRLVEFLNRFSAIIREESFSMNFDYFSMHMRCTSLL
jgi:hypothetical protein